MFNDRINHFESLGIARCLQLMFEIGVRNMDALDISRTFNDNTGALELLEITREDVVADGIFRPVGSKHFAARNKRIQELNGLLGIVASSPQVGRHVSGWKVAQMLEQELGFERYGLVSENIAITEELQSQMQAQMIQQRMQALASSMGPQPGMEAGPPVEVAF
jgi:hypothetical protein